MKISAGDPQTTPIFSPCRSDGPAMARPRAAYSPLSVNRCGVAKATLSARSEVTPNCAAITSIRPSVSALTRSPAPNGTNATRTLK